MLSQLQFAVVSIFEIPLRATVVMAKGSDFTKQAPENLTSSERGVCMYVCQLLLMVRIMKFSCLSKSLRTTFTLDKASRRR